MYTVKQVAALTGVAEATLRVWERRYRVVEPVRSPGGYRLYDEAQVERLREMAALVEGGVPASRAAATVRAAAPVEHAPLPGLPAGGDLAAAAATLDPGPLAAVIDRALASGPFEQVADAWILPELTRLGEAWASGRLSIAGEHFASSALMRSIAAVFEAARGDGHGAAVLVGLPAGEHHELGLLTFATCLRRRGVNVVYLGGDVPAREWERAAARRRARAAVIGVSSPQAAAEAEVVTGLLKAVTPPLSVWVGGSLRHEVPGAHHLPDAVAEAAATLQLSLESGRT